VLREAIFYYHRSGRSRFKRALPEGYFDDLPETWNKSLSHLDDEYYALDGERSLLEEKLVQLRPELFEQPSNKLLERARGR
jgi:hypothetical protein